MLVVLYFMKNVVPNVADKASSIREKFFSGLTYIRSSKNILPILLICALIGLTSAFPIVLMPVFVKDIFHLDARGLGIFMSAIGVGAILGTAKVVLRKKTEGLCRLIISSSMGFGLAVIAFGLSKNIFFAVLFLVLSGYFMVVEMVASNTYMQTIVPDNMRGRIMGFFAMAFIGFTPVGSLISGFLANKISAQLTVAAGGFLSIVVTAIIRKKILKTNQ